MMNMIWRCPHCGGSLDTAGRCGCGHGQPTTEVQVTFTPTYIPTGWKCPQCGRIHAPHIATCPFCAPYCQPGEITWIGTFPNTWRSDGTSQPAGGGWDSITVGDPPNTVGLHVEMASCVPDELDETRPRMRVTLLPGRHRIRRRRSRRRPLLRISHRQPARQRRRR